MRWLERGPWFVVAPAVLVVAAGVGWFGYTFAGDLFVQTCTVEANLLTGEAEASNCGDEAAVSARATTTATPADTATATPAATETPATGTPAASPTASPTPAASGAGVLARAMFRDGEPGHDGEGRAELQRLADGMLNLYVADFSVTSGPDLFVVLSTSPDGYTGDGVLVLERLKANNGNQNYAIPAGTDLARYRSIVIWCRQFDVDFAIATLEVQ
ncbi:MAG: DM13 domain-containing protein [Dehalococcoidia bacterium]|nr:DM13 domain-containing protein [Dehalococcoidia bacterium]